LISKRQQKKVPANFAATYINNNNNHQKNILHTTCISSTGPIVFTTSAQQLIEIFKGAEH
jgi:hypothetical protein